MTKSIGKCLMSILLVFLGYVLIGNLFHRVVFPETEPGEEMYPNAGDTIINPFAGEKIIFLKSGIETGGAFSEREFHLMPNGSVPKAHIHDYDENFHVVQGKLTLRVSDEIYVLQAGDSKTVPRGTIHHPQNQEAVELITINRVTPAGKHDLMLAQTHGFLTEKNKPRSKAEFFLQAMLFVDYYGTYMAGLPVRVQKTLSFIMAPTARLLGYRTWRPEYSKKWKTKYNMSKYP